MRKIIYAFCTLLCVSTLVMSCSEEEMPDPDYDNWAVRNAVYFEEVMNTAKAAVKEARATYGADWESHCNWRLFRSYLKTQHATLTINDSICAYIIERGSGSGCPVYTDSVLVNYIGRTMPTVSFPEGRVFDHSGVYNDPEQVFNPVFAKPAALHVANTVEGFTTAMQNIHVGDRWKLYIPSNLGYGGASPSKVMPPHSTLIFDLQLQDYCHAGSNFME